MHATTAYLRARSASSRVASGGTRACSARSTIGARVPSMSQRTAERSGLSATGFRASASISAVGAVTTLVCPPMSARLLRLAVIGSLAGAFSGLFGVGGGTVVVPLLILWFGYGEREATGTSLAAIVIVAGLAAGTHGLYGNVHVGKGLIVAVPAMAGGLAGGPPPPRLPQRGGSGAVALPPVASPSLLHFYVSCPT